MRAYRQRELPVRLKSVEGAHAEFRVGERERVVVAEGEILTGTELRVIRVRKRMESGKESKGRPREVSVVEIEGGGGVRREWVTGLPATAHDPVALVEDQVDGVYYVAVTGARFRARDGREFVVADVRPNQVVVADVVSGEARTIRLIGPRG